MSNVSKWAGMDEYRSALCNKGGREGGRKEEGIDRGMEGETDGGRER